jgi:hypothetical protein
LRANKLCGDVAETVKEMRATCQRLDQELKEWLLSRKYGSAPSGATSAR